MSSGGSNLVPLTNEVREKLIEMASTGASMTQMVKELGITKGLLSAWRRRHTDFENSLTHARKHGREYAVDGLLDIVDTEPDVNKARLKCDVVKWIASKLDPETYGDRLDVNINQTVDIGRALADARNRSLPARDLSNVKDAELVETKQLECVVVSDCVSVDSIPKTLNELLE